MEQDLRKTGSQENKQTLQKSEQPSTQNDKQTTENSPKVEALKDKVNVDQAAIDEARDAVGDDDAKIKEYLVNNRGL